MNGIDWGMVFGVVALILLQASFAVGAVILFFAVKAQVDRTKDVYNNHLRETERLKSQSDSLTKKIERYEAKIEELKKTKIDGWEESDSELAKKIKTVNARVSALYSKLSRAEEEPEEPPENFQYPGYPQPTEEQHNSRGVADTFGQVAR